MTIPEFIAAGIAGGFTLCMLCDGVAMCWSFIMGMADSTVD